MYPYHKEGASPRTAFYTNSANNGSGGGGGGVGGAASGSAGGIGSRYTSYSSLYDGLERSRPTLPFSSSSSSVTLPSSDDVVQQRMVATHPSQHYHTQRSGDQEYIGMTTPRPSSPPPPSANSRAFYPSAEAFQSQAYQHARHAAAAHSSTTYFSASPEDEGMALAAADPSQARPYRSRKDRPCDHCRKRKGRCVIEVVGQDCRSCQKNGQHCTFDMSPTPRSRPIKNEDGVTIASVIVPRKRSKSYGKPGTSGSGGGGASVQDSTEGGTGGSNDSVAIPIEASPANTTTIKRRRISLVDPASAIVSSIGEKDGGPAKAEHLYGLFSALINNDDDRTAKNEGQTSARDAIATINRSGDGENEEEKGMMPVVLGSSSSEDPQLLRQAGGTGGVSDGQDDRGESFVQNSNDEPDIGVANNVKTVGPLQVRQVTNDPGRPIFFAYVPASPYGRKGSAKEIGSQGLTKLKQSLAGRIGQLATLYATRDSCAFPLLMQSQRNKFRLVASESRRDHTKTDIPLPAVLSAALLATATVYDPSLRPTSKEAWGANLHALMEQFEIATLTTVQVALTDLTGRPSINTSGNFMTLNQTLAISQMLGLHLDPSDWQLPQEEKDVRVRLWWAIVIHDKWSALCWGRPSGIQKQNFSVPFPRRDDLSVCSAHLRDDDLRTFDFAPAWCRERTIHTPGDTFAALCRLTMILSDIIDEFYSVRQAQRLQRDEHAVAQRVKDYLIALEDWKQMQPQSLACILKGQQGETKLSELAVKVPGTRSLQLSYLGVNLLLCRTALDSVTTRSSHNVDRHLVAHNTALHASVMLVEFLESLDQDDLAGFYLHYGSHHLASCLSMLARLCLGFSRMEESKSLSSCVAAIQRLLVALTQAHRSSSWDLAELALTRSRAILPALEARVASFPSFFAGGTDDSSSQLTTPVSTLLQSPQDVLDAAASVRGGTSSADGLADVGGVVGVTRHATPSMYVGGKASTMAANMLKSAQSAAEMTSNGVVNFSSPFLGVNAIPFDAAGVPYPLTNVHAGDAAAIMQQSLPAGTYGGEAMASQLLSGMELDWLELGFPANANGGGGEAPFLS